MRRRTVLRWIASLGGATGLTGLRGWAQTAGFPGDQAPTLAAIAAIVLPSELGEEGIRTVSQNFERWVREYRPGAEMDHGYGVTRLRYKPASPAPAYLRQLEALRPSLTTGDAASRRNAIEAALKAARITDLPRSPDGRHIAADLMAFYFRGSDANDLCYRAAIGRDQCRGLARSDNPPPELRP